MADLKSAPDLKSAILFLFAATMQILSASFEMQCPALAYTIEGKIEHQEALPQVESSVRKGAKYQAGLSELEANNNWVQLPAWIAGTWSVKEETAVLRQDFKSGQVDRHPTRFATSQEFTYGSQKDRQGGIWHYIGVPYTSKTHMSDYQEIHEVKEKKFLVADENMVEFRSVVTVVRVGNDSGRVADSFQQESITSYKPYSAGQIELSASTKTFDGAGRAVFQQDNVAKIRRSKRFFLVDHKDGKDLKELFVQYLTAKGLTNLLP